MRITKISWSHTETRSYDYQSVALGCGLEAELSEGEDLDTSLNKLRDFLQAKVESEADVAQAALVEWRDKTRPQEDQ